ncbi:unnamed protein product [marine sediment metagenome]|uniref:Uncharacterized protein n=1 Tax=marine sediment metagenome TaxID=412755 RepID=X1IFW8_9ZZZZ
MYNDGYLFGNIEDMYNPLDDWHVSLREKMRYLGQLKESG